MRKRVYPKNREDKDFRIFLLLKIEPTPSGNGIRVGEVRCILLGLSKGDNYLREKVSPSR